MKGKTGTIRTVQLKIKNLNTVLYSVFIGTPQNLPRKKEQPQERVLICFIILGHLASFINLGMSLTLPASLLAKGIIFLSTGQLWGKMTLAMTRDLKIWMLSYKYLSP